MNHITWAKLLEEERKFVVKEMKKQKLRPSQLAGLANLSPPTVTNFIEGITFFPGHRTIISMIDALGYEEVRLPKSSVVKGKKGRKRKAK